MRKIYLFIFISLFATSLYAQHGRNATPVKCLSIAVKGGGGNSILINSDAMKDAGAEFNYITPSFGYGGRLTLTYGDFIGFGVDFMNTHFGQEYSIKYKDLSYTKTISLKTMDITPFFRYTSLKGVYVEIGPRFSTLKTAEEKNSIDDDFRPTTDMKNQYENKITSMLFGAGLPLFKNERINFNLGFRATYGFSDLITDENYYVLNDGVNVPDYVATAKTNPFVFQGILELDYIFGFWGKASCGKGRLVFFQ